MEGIETYFKDVDAHFEWNKGVEVVAGHPQKAYIKAYVMQYDRDFYEPLSARVDMDTFSQKLSDLSTTFMVFKDGVLAGLICAYFYNPESRKGFVTLVHTKHEYRGKHLAVPLLDAVKSYAKDHGFESIDLFVSKQQVSAYNLYFRHGFESVEEEENGRCKMNCKL